VSSPLRRLEASYRSAAAQGRTVVGMPGFVACLSPTSANAFLSVAIPTDEAPDDWEAALVALSAMFERCGRRARIELFAELHPDLLVAADATGWVRAMTAPVLTLEPTALAAAPPPGEGVYRPLDPNDEPRIEAALRGQGVAYGGEPGDPGALDWFPSLVAGLRDGSVRAGAVDVGGEPVAGGSLQVGGAVGELAGVWTYPSQRRRGLARQACHALLSEAFAAGVSLAWLSAAPDALALYVALGFVPVGTQVNLEAPPISSVR
jgi:ribosomal protein S18 acetylase RimI-like enzyme